MNNIEIYPSRLALLACVFLSMVPVLTYAYSQLSAWQSIALLAFVMMWSTYECKQFFLRGRLVRIEIISDQRVILHYAQGLTREGPLSKSIFVNRWFIFYRVGGWPHILFHDALHPEDFRRLTVNLLWCKV